MNYDRYLGLRKYKIEMKKRNWKRYIFEFLSIFIAVISAFALNNWNENRRDNQAANKILTEISNGLQKDMEDININVEGHVSGIKACNFWRKLILNEEVNLDYLNQHYFNLTRDFFSAQNVSGYETLKSRGLELIKNDSLRFNIISLYEYDFEALKTMEENYYEMQFQQNYYKEINSYISPYFVFDTIGNISKIKTPLRLKPEERNIFLTYLWKIQINRNYILQYYSDMEKKINELIEQIKKERKR